MTKLSKYILHITLITLLIFFPFYNILKVEANVHTKKDLDFYVPTKTTYELYINDISFGKIDDIFTNANTKYISLDLLAQILISDTYTLDDNNNIHISYNNNYILIDNDITYAKTNESIYPLDGNSFFFNQELYVPIELFATILGANDVVINNNDFIITIEKEDISIPKGVFPYEYEPIIESITTFIEPEEEEIEETEAEEIEETEPELEIIEETPEDTITEPPKKEETPEEIEPDVAKSDDLTWLARLIQVEAGYESYEGKLAVANVILNRKSSSLFPNTVYDVIFDTQYGVQFPPAHSGKLNITPSQESIQAAQDALNGNNNIANCLYFVPASASSSWAAQNREFYMQIGNQNFYK